MKTRICEQGRAVEFEAETPADLKLFADLRTQLNEANLKFGTRPLYSSFVQGDSGTFRFPLINREEGVKIKLFRTM